MKDTLLLLPFGYQIDVHALFHKAKHVKFKKNSRNVKVKTFLVFITKNGLKFATTFAKPLW